MQLEIKSLHRRLGITVLYVTHDQDEAMAMSDRICLMNHGRIEQIGTPQELYFRPAQLFAADFLGEFEHPRRRRSPTVATSSLARRGMRHASDGGGRRERRRSGVKLVIRPESLRISCGHGETADNIAEGELGETRLRRRRVPGYFVRPVRWGRAVSAKQLTDQTGQRCRAGQRACASAGAREHGCDAAARMTIAVRPAPSGRRCSQSAWVQAWPVYPLFLLLAGVLRLSGRADPGG